MDPTEDIYEYNNCPIKISFYVTFNISDEHINKKKLDLNRCHLKFETIKNTIAEPMKEDENSFVEDLKIYNSIDKERFSVRIKSEKDNVLKYFIKNQELDFSIPKLFRIKFLSNETEMPESTYTFSLAELFLHAFEKENFKPNTIQFNQLHTRDFSAKELDKNYDDLTIRFKKKIKYPKEPKAENTTYITQEISKFVKTTTSYDVIVTRHDFNFFKSLFLTPYTQLVVRCEDEGIYDDTKNEFVVEKGKNKGKDKDKEEVKGKEIYSSPIFVNALYFKIDTFNILTSKYTDKNGVPRNQIFELIDWSWKEKTIHRESIQKSERKNKLNEDEDEDESEINNSNANENPPKDKSSNNKKDASKNKKDKKDEKKYFSVEKRDISERTFVQLLCNGTRIQTIIAIDFSSSNRPVLIKNSRHSGDRHTNLYLGAMNCIFDTLSVFDESCSVSLYGLAAKMKGVFHEFFPITKTKESEYKKDVNFEIDNKYSSKEEMEKAYNYYCQMLQFWGPTKFSGFLKFAGELAKKANDKNKNIYTVLTIITDGLIVDLHDIVETISEMNKCPIFIVFVGIGEEKSDRGFLSLKQIDNNLNRKKSLNESQDSIHDIVKFAHFKTENLVEKSSFSHDLFHDIPDEMARFMNQRDNKEDND